MVHIQVKMPGLMAIKQKFGEQNDAYWMILQNIHQHYSMVKAMEQGQNPSELPPELEGALQKGMIEEQENASQNATGAPPMGSMLPSPA